MSVLFALAMTAVQAGDRAVVAFTPKMGQVAPTTLRVPYGPRVYRDRATGHSDLRYEHARIVVPRGAALRPDNESHWTAYTFESRLRPPNAPRLLAIAAIFFTLAMGLTAYLRRFGHHRLRLLRAQAGLLVLMVAVGALAKALLVFSSLSEFWIPVAAVPLWVATFFDRRTAFVVTVVFSFVAASLLEFDLILLCALLASGMSATLLYLDRRNTRQMVLAGALSGLCTVALFLALMVVFQGQFDWRLDLLKVSDSQILACFGGGLFSGLLGAVLRAPAARLLGHVPRERLVDLSDLEQPLLQRLAREAPGTYEHSRAMANLAEQAASAIGADALLTRVGAYYHDLGKSTQPKYFVENLGPDERSPHDDLDPEVSADAIMAHVVLGAKILREGGVPEPVVEFAYTHHGTQLVEYFWNKCLQQGNPKALDPSAFRYPGMRPQTRETAIVMLVDSIEAASRTIDPPDREAFENMIQRILFTKLRDGQLDDSGLDMANLNVLANRMADTLVNMHHHRIKYQWQAKRAQEFGVPSTAVSIAPGSYRAEPASSPETSAHSPSALVSLPDSDLTEVGDGGSQPHAAYTAPPATARSSAVSELLTPNATESQARPAPSGPAPAAPRAGGERSGRAS